MDASRQAAIDANASECASLGCQTRCGKRSANQIACSPVPLATSRTVPLSGSHPPGPPQWVHGCAERPELSAAHQRRRTLVEAPVRHLLRRLGRLPILVDQHRLARRQRLVEPPARRINRRRLEALSPAFARAAIERSAMMNWSRLALRFGLGRLDQHRAMDDQREVHGHRVEALVDQRLGDVDVLSPPPKPRSEKIASCMHGPLVAERRVENVLERAQDVIGVEHRILGDLAKAVGAVAQHVGERRA